MKILFVCTGNTCRSPMAGAIAEQLLGDKYKIYSAGLMAMPNSRASAHAVTIMAERQIDLSKHKSRLVSEELLTEMDLVLAMTESHKGALINSIPDKVFTLGEYAGCQTSVTDPFGGNLDEYRACADEIYKLLLKAAEKIKN